MAVVVVVVVAGDTIRSVTIHWALCLMSLIAMNL